MVTMKDVALRAGVSTATVSHVVNQSRPVGTKTKQLVEKAIEDLRYRPDGIARSLRLNNTGTIAVLVADIANPFFADFVRGVEDAARGSAGRYNLLLCNTEESPEQERRALDLVLGRRIDGIVMAPTGGNEAFLCDVIEGGQPVVFADRQLSGVQADCVLSNNYEMAAELARHLIDIGHRRFAILRADLTASAIQERIDGFHHALRSNALDLAPELVVTSPSDIAAAVRESSRLIRAAQRPDAVFCTNNFMTLGLVQALHEDGLRCPRDMAVVGFDDFPWAEAFRPRLTVVSQPAHQIGLEAANLLFDRISGRRTGPSIQMRLGAKLILRESCGRSLAHA